MRRSLSVSMRAVPVLWCLLCVLSLSHPVSADSSPDPSPSSSLHTTSLSLSDLLSSRPLVVADVIARDAYLMTKLLAAYQLQAPDVTITVGVTDQTGTQRVLDNQADCAITGTQQTYNQQHTHGQATNTQGGRVRV